MNCWNIMYPNKNKCVDLHLLDSGNTALLACIPHRSVIFAPALHATWRPALLCLHQGCRPSPLVSSRGQAAAAPDPPAMGWQADAAVDAAAAALVCGTRRRPCLRFQQTSSPAIDSSFALLIPVACNVLDSSTFPFLMSPCSSSE